jgi:hypothetical protein
MPVPGVSRDRSHFPFCRHARPEGIKFTLLSQHLLCELEQKGEYLVQFFAWVSVRHGDSRLTIPVHRRGHAPETVDS